jgi:nucleotide-binding universal stress UspA family protein
VTVPEHGRVVVGVDGSPASREAARWAAESADPGRPLHLLHAFAWPAPQYYVGGGLAGGVAEPYGDELRRTATEMLAALEAEVRPLHPDVTSELVLGPAAQVLLDAAQTAATVVVGSRGLGGFTGLLVGSIGTQLAGHAECPVIVVRGAPAERSGRIVVGVDPPAESDAAVEFAFAEATRRRAELTVVHAWATPSVAGAGSEAPRTYDPDAVAEAEADRLIDRMAPWGEKFPGVAVHPLVRHGRPAPALLAASEGADLLVVGSHGHGALHDLILGSVTNSVLHAAPCPVAIVPTRRHGQRVGQVSDTE